LEEHENMKKGIKPVVSTKDKKDLASDKSTPTETKPKTRQMLKGLSLFK
jgi:hypothetical protein